MDKDITKKYSNEEITVVWKPKVCIHSAVCFRGLPGVFNPKIKPWVTIEGGSSEEIMAQIDKCPSGALSYYRNESEGLQEETVKTQMEILPNGPILVYGTIEVKDKILASFRRGLMRSLPESLLADEQFNQFMVQR